MLVDLVGLTILFGTIFAFIYVIVGDRAYNRGVTDENQRLAQHLGMDFKPTGDIEADLRRYMKNVDKRYRGNSMRFFEKLLQKPIKWDYWPSPLLRNK